MGLIKPLLYTLRELFRKPVTVKYPYEKRDISPRVRNIHTLNRETCQHCGICARMCPNNVLKMKDGYPTADYSRCSFCGICLDACPTGSIQMIHTQEHNIVRAHSEDLYMELLNPDGTVYNPEVASIGQDETNEGGVF